jgi:3-dehydroquinate synthase
MVNQLLLIMGGQRFDMSSLEVRSQSGNYKIRFESSNLISNAAAFALIDSKVPKNLFEAIPDHLSIEVNEEIKTLATVEQIVSAMRVAGQTRADVLVAVGGGVIQDLATISASLYMRGVNWIYYPSTLASMVDSCVGGKSSINASSFKNLLGNIYPPKEIVINSRFIDSLPADEYLCGLAEGVKICFAKGKKQFRDFINNPAAHLQGDGKQLEELVSLSLRSKIWFVEIDEFDKGERQLLNFGHSFGHALESASGFRIPHGIAVALGMLAATDPRWGELDESTSELRTYLRVMLTRWNSKSYALQGLDWDIFEKSIRQDKKNSPSSINLILSHGPGSLYVRELQKNQETSSILQAVAQTAVQEILSS